MQYVCWSPSFGSSLEEADSPPTAAIKFATQALRHRDDPLGEIPVFVAISEAASKVLLFRVQRTTQIVGT